MGEAKQLPVLVIDEAQHLRNDVLEDLRLLCNFMMDSDNRLCLVLVGLTELRRRLAMAVHESLSQRLVVRHHLNGLDRDELDHYLTHRLRLAGCELPVFEPPAVEALFQSARGLPRLINRIAHYAMTAAALNNARTVNAEHLQHAIEEWAPMNLPDLLLPYETQRRGPPLTSPRSSTTSPPPSTANTSVRSCATTTSSTSAPTSNAPAMTGSSTSSKATTCHCRIAHHAHDHQQRAPVRQPQVHGRVHPHPEHRDHRHHCNHHGGRRPQSAPHRLSDKGGTM